MKKLFAVLLTVVMIISVLTMTACVGNNSKADLQAIPELDEQYLDLSIPADFKVGLICLHDKNSTYDLNFINAMEETKLTLGLSDEQVIIKTNIPEGNDCLTAANDLVDQGCDIIFADSFGHEDYMIAAAKAHPDVEFCHATGVKAHTENLANYHNAFAAIYEGRYLAGIAAGLKLNEMITAGKITAQQAKMGYVGAFTYAEVISGYTSFYLGAKSVCPTVTMDVTFTGSWYDESAERNAANKLIDQHNCVLISQHADSMGAPSACEAKGVPNVSYNGSTDASCPSTFIVSSKINWAPYYKFAIAAAVNNEAIPYDWCGTIATGSVQLTAVNLTAAAQGTVEAIVAARAKLAAGTLHVFDTTKFTVENAAKSSYLADVNYDAAFTPDTEAIGGGYFHESEYRSAPYFDLAIDGITRLDVNFG